MKFENSKTLQNALISVVKVIIAMSFLAKSF